MSVTLKPVIWYRSKLVYDGVVLLAMALYIIAYLRLAPTLQLVSRPIDDAILRMRAFGSCAFLMVSFILAIGPLSRLDRRFLPLLYNRRHFGVIACSVACAHVYYVYSWYLNLSPLNPLLALFSANTSYGQVLGFPFEIFGVLALVILLALAFTSHDFWLSFLTPRLWKSLHMLIYIAYGAIVAHIALGSFQASGDPFFVMIVCASALGLVGVHLAARSVSRAGEGTAGDDNWVDAGLISTIADKRARIIDLGEGEKVAIFRYDGKLSALTNLCAHQNGPLGEGRIIDGCVTCPWHGFQYRPEDGCAPAPFTEKVATYRLRRDLDRLWLDRRANPPGTRVEPLPISEGMADGR
ncbi:MAG: ferric reductase-like transmembrane domain-containing protein [Hyphomicrobiales bacterium]|nr:ferric reductase-like transmembrane domain-containing protein [Hyphomicrobiales bacterium]